MTGLETKLTLEATKQTGGFLKFLLGPKLNKIKHSIEEYHIENTISNIDLDNTFNPYLKSFARKVSTLKTLVFPLQSLPIEEIYEPLSLKINNNSNTDLRNIDSLSFLIERATQSIIIDGAGMGKSTFLKHLAIDTMLNTSYIPLFIEFKNIKEEETLLDTMYTELQGLRNGVEKEVFFKLLELEKFCLFLDGFDEISRSQQTVIGNQIRDFTNKSDIPIIITTRPNTDFPSLHNFNVYSFLPLNEEEAKSLIKRYDKFSSQPLGNELISQLSSVPKRFLEVPILIALLYRTYSYNRNIADKMTTFYDELYNAMYKGHDLTKVGFTRAKLSKLDYENFRNLLRALSFYMMITDQEILENDSQAIDCISNATKIACVIPNSNKDFLDDLIGSVPLLFKDGTSYRFLHKTIMEYFCAEYLAYDDNATTTLKEVFSSKVSSVFEKTYDMLEELKPILYKTSIVKPFSKKYLSKADRNINDFFNMLFFYKNIYISLWEMEEITTKNIRKETLKDGSIVEHERTDMEHPNKPDKVNEMHFFYGNHGNKKYVLTLASSNNNYSYIPNGVHKYLSNKEDLLNVASRNHEDIDITYFKNFLPVRKWININSPDFYEHYDNKLFEKIVKNAYMMYIDISSKNGIISISKCDEILKSDDDTERSTLINSLINKDSKA